jgi:hypothetical protein
MKRSLIAAALLAAATAPAYAAIPHVGDETDLSWQYTAPTAKPFFADAPATFAKAPVRIGDENDTSWIYTPAARPLFAQAGASASAQPYVEFADENNFAWLYQAPSAGQFADPRRQEPYVAFGTTKNPLTGLVESVERIGKSHSSGE